MVNQAALQNADKLSRILRLKEASNIAKASQVNRAKWGSDIGWADKDVRESLNRAGTASWKRSNIARNEPLVHSTRST